MSFPEPIETPDPFDRDAAHDDLRAAVNAYTPASHEQPSTTDRTRQQHRKNAEAFAELINDYLN